MSAMASPVVERGCRWGRERERARKCERAEVKARKKKGRMALIKHRRRIETVPHVSSPSPYHPRNLIWVHLHQLAHLLLGSLADHSLSPFPLAPPASLPFHYPSPIPRCSIADDCSPPPPLVEYNGDIPPTTESLSVSISVSHRVPAIPPNKIIIRCGGVNDLFVSHLSPNR